MAKARRPGRRERNGRRQRSAANDADRQETEWATLSPVLERRCAELGWRPTIDNLRKVRGRSLRMMPHWYAAIVKRGRERAFCGYLAEAGFEGYVPRETRLVVVGRRPKRREKREVPIIRGLVLIGAAADLAGDPYAWHEVARLPFYNGLVGTGGDPRKITQAEIDRMEAECEKRGAGLRVGAPEPRVKVGDEARMTAGAFEGIRAAVKEMQGRRAVVLLQLFGGERELDVDAMGLEPWVAE